MLLSKQEMIALKSKIKEVQKKAKVKLVLLQHLV